MITTMVATGALFATGFSIAHWFREKLKGIWARTIGPSVDSIMSRITLKLDNIVDNLLTRLKGIYGYPYVNMTVIHKAQEILSRVWLRIAHKVGPEQFVRMMIMQPTVVVPTISVA